MRQVYVLALVLIINTARSQSDTTYWQGTIVTPVMEVTVELGIINETTGVLRSPEQSAQLFDVMLRPTSEDSLSCNITQLGAKYMGIYSGDSVVGQWIQSGSSIPLTLHKGRYNLVRLKRPQEPTPPYPYQTLDLAIANREADSIILQGTMTQPHSLSDSPIAILISGSGPQDRDETLLGHKPFLVLSDYLTRQGISVLRCDDRGVGQSEGDHSSATTYDFARDVSAIIDFLKSDPRFLSRKLGLIGHSEGGLIATIVISRRPADIDFFVSLAGPGVNGKSTLVSQTVAGLRVAGANNNLIRVDSTIVTTICDRILNYDTTSLSADIVNLIDSVLVEEEGYPKAKYTPPAKEQVAAAFSSAWMTTYMKIEPTDYLSKVKCPTLLLNGSKDIQVLSSLHLPVMYSTITANGNEDVSKHELSDLNHLFQTARTGTIFEYQQIDETLAPRAMQLIADWINERF